MNAHIINCDETEFFDSFRPSGYLGVKVGVGGTTPQALSKSCRTIYSMQADMKTIRVGDIIFVHAGQKIYGAFKAATEFHETPDTPPYFLSRNIHYYPKPNNPNSGWKNNDSIRPNATGYYRHIAITHFVDDQGNNLCFENGIQSTEVFEIKRRKKIWSIPERWKYTDAARTVRPLMANEAFELLKIIHRANADNPDRLIVEPADFENYLPIQFILDDRIVTNEKIIEGWVLENIGRNSDLDDAFGPFSSFGNNMPAGYLKFMDIFGYQQLSTGMKIYKVVEIKKDECSFPDDINQLIGYTNWVTQNIASGDYKSVEAAIIAKSFDEDCTNFVANFNTTGNNIRLIRFDYIPPNYDTLNIRRVV